MICYCKYSSLQVGAPDNQTYKLHVPLHHTEFYTQPEVDHHI